ncbi:MAG: sensor histidine kinase [Lysobacterales bacterium]
MIPQTPARRFWLFNALVWALYFALNTFLFTSFAGWSSGIVLISLVLSVGMYLVSGGLRWQALRRDWFSLRPTTILLRLLFTVMFGAALVQTLIQIVLRLALYWHWVSLPEGGNFQPVAIFSYWINTAIVLALWTAAWVGVHAFRRYRHGEVARLKAEAARHALELDALRARLNPHFVFNALNNLRALINEDTERARELVTRLSNTLRHALEHRQSERVTLADELAVVRDYLAVEQVHYEQRLRIREEIAEAALAATLPPMLLQLLVENAIKHGIARTAGGGELGIGASLQAQRLLLTVSNPGVLHNQGTPEATGTGVGLVYLRSELARLPGTASLELRQDGNTVLATLEIPQ